MLRRLIKTWLILCVAIITVGPNSARASMLELLPSSTSVIVGDSFSINIIADIDEADAIIGFGFDVIQTAGTGLAGAVPPIFTRGPLFAEDPIWLTPFSDPDGINGASGGDLLFGPPVWGDDILLGTLWLEALVVGDVTFDLAADDLDVFFTEGLIPADHNLPNFLPEVTAANINVVPAPAAILLLGSGLVALIAARRKLNR